MCSFTLCLVFLFVLYARATNLCVQTTSSCPPGPSICCFDIPDLHCCSLPPDFLFFASYPQNIQVNYYKKADGQPTCSSFAGQCDAGQGSCCVAALGFIQFANAIPSNPSAPNRRRHILPRGELVQSELVYPNYVAYMDGDKLTELEIPKGLHLEATDALVSGNYSVFTGWKPFVKPLLVE